MRLNNGDNILNIQNKNKCTNNGRIRKQMWKLVCDKQIHIKLLIYVKTFNMIRKSGGDDIVDKIKTLAEYIYGANYIWKSFSAQCKILKFGDVVVDNRFYVTVGHDICATSFFFLRNNLLKKKYLEKYVVCKIQLRHFENEWLCENFLLKTKHWVG